MNQEYMKEKPILPLLLSMSLPMMMSMLIQALYNIVDTMFVSKLGQDALTALSLAFPVQNLLIAVSVGTGVGILIDAQPRDLTGKLIISCVFEADHTAVTGGQILDRLIGIDRNVHSFPCPGANTVHLRSGHMCAIEDQL